MCRTTTSAVCARRCVGVGVGTFVITANINVIEIYFNLISPKYKTET